MCDKLVRTFCLRRNFTGLAIFITCVGIFGLASFIAQQKTKEIGIRKAMGASNNQILVSLLMIFVRIMLVASLLAIPLSLYLTNEWLQNFVYRTPLSWVIFFGGILIIGVLTIVTVSYESLKASTSNPVKALKYE